jgi:dihydrolipoamide dehydrogenase
MKYDLIIIGSGPAGYVAAIRAGQTGLKTAIIEKTDIGGMCLNWGCIPSKALIESAKLYNRIISDSAKFGIDGIDKKNVRFNYPNAARRAKTIVTRLTKGVEFLLKKNGVEIIRAEASILSANVVLAENRKLETQNIIIATGTKFPKIAVDPENILIDIRNLFTDREIPENIVVAGQDAVCIEMAQMFASIGKNVTVALPGERFMPLADEYLSNYMFSVFKKEKIHVVRNIDFNSPLQVKEKTLTFGAETVKCDALINALPRTGVIPAHEIDLETENGFLKTDEDCQTPVAGIYAVGDVNGKSHFAHVASAQGLHVVNLIKGIKHKLDLKKYPINMYSNPEMSQIGSTEAELKEQNTDYKISEFPISANGKAMTEGNAEGFIRILSEKKFGEVLGVQIVAQHATDMIAEAAAFMQLESTIYDVAQTVHAHPTVSEIFMEAGFEGIDGAIHK